MHRVVTPLILLAAALAASPPASAATTDRPWPPRAGAGALYAHIGEEHINDIDGAKVLPAVVAQLARYRPDLVTMSGDKADDGVPEQLEQWRAVMDALDRAGVPYMAAVGNHDGRQPTPEAVTDAQGGVTPLRDIGHYKEVFAGRPYPMGDATPYDRPGFLPRARPADDPHGAATHYAIDTPGVRWVFIDNSCYGIINCDNLQNPPDGKGRTQYEFLRDAAREADQQKRLVFVVMHMPTRDPRDQDTSTPLHRMHTMGKGSSPDNVTFEREAAALGVDGVFLGHIKGQFLYRGQGDVPYFIDGGAGGELYSGGPLGVDHGYWYGFRLLRVDGGRLRSEVVPVIVPGGIRIKGPTELTRPGGRSRWEAFATQPATESRRAVVKNLELRDPDPVPKSRGWTLPPWAPWLVPLLAVPLLVLLAARAAARSRRLALRVAAVAGLGGMAAVTGIAGAQQSVPTSTPRESLPNPARIWTSSDARILAPVASDSDDPRRDPRTQTADGGFRPVCPGRATLTITSGFETASTAVTVKSDGKRRILRSLLARERRPTAGRRAVVGALRLEQAAVVRARVLRGRRVVARLRDECMPRGARRIRWRPARAGSHVVEVRIASDRRTIVRRLRVQVQPRR